jgi:hypothetical protein
MQVAQDVPESEQLRVVCERSNKRLLIIVNCTFTFQFILLNDLRREQTSRNPSLPRMAAYPRRCASRQS